MFIGLSYENVCFEVVGLPHRRTPGTTPVLRVRASFVEQIDLSLGLVFSSRDELLILLEAQDAERTLKAKELSQVPQLFSLGAAMDKVAEATLKFGQNPVDVVATAFDSMGKTDIEAKLLLAGWWLKYGLSGEAYYEYLSGWTKAHELLQFVAGIQIPDLATIEYEQGTPMEVYGMTYLNWLLFYHPGLVTELQLALNNGALKVKFEVVSSATEVSRRWATASDEWQQHYGTMWGPFGS